MKIALCQLEVYPGQPYKNLKKALAFTQQAQEQGADLIAFPEMALPGYLLGDLWERSSFLKECEQAQDELRKASSSIAIAFGGLAVDWNKTNEDGRVRKYNALYIAHQGQFLHPAQSQRPYAVKTLMPNYREFDDSRHFFDTRKLALEEGVSIEKLIQPFALNHNSKTTRIGAMLCEDSWSHDYTSDIPNILLDKQIDFFLNLSCSPFTQGKNSKRHRVFSTLSRKKGKPLLYCNCTGLQNNGKNVYTFDGGTTIYHDNGFRGAEAKPFEETLLYVHPNQSTSTDTLPHQDDLLQALKYGTKKFIENCQIQKVVIGASGGIDSSLAAAIYSDVLEPEQLLLVNMPSKFNSKSTIHASQQLAERLGCYYTEVPIQEAADLTFKQLEGLPLQGKKVATPTQLELSPLSRENIQARDRSARVLAGIASAWGGVFTCNANKAELTVGYATLYGDMGGFFANLADLWKGQVYECSRLFNEEAGEELIPRKVFELPPSAELSDQQNPEKGQGDPLHYPYHDALFKSWIESWDRKDPTDLLRSYLEQNLEDLLQIEPGIINQLFQSPLEFINDLERWWKQYNGMGLAKRIQSPPILSLSRRAFGFDHREAQVPVLLTQAYQQLKNEVLGTKNTSY